PRGAAALPPPPLPPPGGGGGGGSGRRSCAGRSMWVGEPELGATEGSGVGAPTIVTSDRFVGAADGLGRSVEGCCGIVDRLVAGPRPSSAKSRITAVML